MAASLRRGLVGEQKSREIGTVSTGGVAFFDKAAPQGVGSRLEVRLDGWLDRGMLAGSLAVRPTSPFRRSQFLGNNASKGATLSVP